jgi:hypothetical protein
MGASILAEDFAISIWHPERRLVALLGAYFDDSQSTGDVWVVSGYVGYKNQWDYFEGLWRAVMERHGVPYFHMREMADPDGPFKKWLPPEEHEEERAAFFIDMVGAILKSMLRKISAAVWISDLTKFNAEHGTALEPFPLAAYTCLVQIQQQYHDVPATATFDRIEKIDDKLRKARAYADSDPRTYSDISFIEHIAACGVPKGVTSREIPALQAADLVAWEFRKALFGMKEWQLSPDRPMTDRHSQWLHYLQWTKEKKGTGPVLRKSLEALITNLRTHSVVWDWHQLDSTHKARNGIWTVEAAASAARRRV